MTIAVTVERVEQPRGQTIAYGYGTTEDGRFIRWAGDHRPMRHIAEALAAGELVEVEIESWQII